jgi:rubredoxin
MKMKYFYCSACGYEDMDISVAFSATYANGDFYHCPECHHESSDFELDEE